jgi:antitoxin VapB
MIKKVDHMSLNIKNEETHRLVKELSEKTGESMTTAVTIAVRERLDRVRAEQGTGLAERLLAIGEHCARYVDEPFKSTDIDELLYDEWGLPK